VWGLVSVLVLAIVQARLYAVQLKLHTCTIAQAEEGNSVSKKDKFMVRSFNCSKSIGLDNGNIHSENTSHTLARQHTATTAECRMHGACMVHA
jgi:hypothetical protein